MGLRTRRWQETGENCVVTRFIDLYVLPGISRAIRPRWVRLGGHVTRMAEERHAYGFIVEKTKGKVQLGRPQRERDANLKMDLKEIV